MKKGHTLACHEYRLKGIGTEPENSLSSYWISMDYGVWDSVCDAKGSRHIGREDIQEIAGVRLRMTWWWSRGEGWRGHDRMIIY